MAILFGVAQAGPIVSPLPLLLIGILFGLAMDYEVFLVSRMRESYVHTGKARDALVTGKREARRLPGLPSSLIRGEHRFQLWPCLAS
jgi:RND superfamily putative drug exporter